MFTAENDLPLSIWLASEVHNRIPTTIRRTLSPVYFRYQSAKANRLHEPPDHSRSTADGSPEHVLIVVIDALRPDHVPSLPFQFSNAISPSTWTFPAITSLHTGQYPHEHGSVAHTHPDDEDYAMPQQTTADTTLPAEFEAAGYETYCGCAFMIPFLALRGWYQTHRVYRDTLAENVISDYLQWRQDRSYTFSYLHLGDLHTPINPPDGYLQGRDINMERIEDQQPCSIFDGCDNCRQYRQHRLNLYGAAYDYVEDQLIALSERITDTLFVVTADHGEGFWEHANLDQLMTDSRPNYGGGHGGTPFDMVARVPVGISAPNGSISRPTGGWGSLRDIGPTLLKAAVGESVIPGRAWQSRLPDDRTVICEAPRFGVERKAAYRGLNKVIRSEADDVTLTARIDRDKPGDDFCELSTEITDRLLASLPDNWNAFDSESGSVGPVLSERLEALGYKS